MNRLIVKPVASAHEFEKAYALALSVFSENSTIDHYNDHKKLTWTKDPYSGYQNILLARYGNEYAGLIRIVPRILYRGNRSYSVAGISSVCLLPSLRGKGLSVPLMDQSLTYCSERGYDFAFLFARRAADHYYTRFGFHGVAAYAKIFVKKNGAPFADTSFSLGEMDLSQISLYAAAYEKSYQNCFGRIERSDAYWHFLLGSLGSRNDCQFKTIRKEGVAIGYMVHNTKKILEIALVPDVPGEGLVGFLLDAKLFEPATDTLELEILPQHSLVDRLKGMDITFQQRECNYGGHMLKIINRTKMSGADIPEKNNYSYEETCRMMGIFSPSSGNGSQVGALPFDISFIDQF